MMFFYFSSDFWGTATSVKIITKTANIMERKNINWILFSPPDRELAI